MKSIPVYLSYTLFWKFLEVLSYTAKLQFPSHSAWVKSIPVSSPYTPKRLWSCFSQPVNGLLWTTKEGDFISGLVDSWIRYLNWKGFELYGESTVSFSPCLGGSTPVSSPYTLLVLDVLLRGFWVIRRIYSFLHTLPKRKYSCFFAVYSVSILFLVRF